MGSGERYVDSGERETWLATGILAMYSYSSTVMASKLAQHNSYQLSADRLSSLLLTVVDKHANILVKSLPELSTSLGLAKILAIIYDISKDFLT